MESDVCGGNVSPTLVGRTDKTVSDDVDSSSPSSVVALGFESAENISDIVSQPVVIQSDNKFQKCRTSLNENQSDDYYEVISADGSVGGDDVDIQDIQDEQDDKIGISKSAMAITVSEGRSVDETCSFNDLPFVPKLEFPLDLSEIANESVPSYGVLSVNRFMSNIPRPDTNFTIPPPNFKLLDIKPSSDFLDPVLNAPCATDISKDENISAVSENLNDEDASCSHSAGVALRNHPVPSKEKDPVVDWLDENGDPIPGAFDYVKPDEDSRLNKSNKVEYMFSVREKKDVPVKSESNDFVNSGFLIYKNVLHKNVAGNLGVLLENQLVPDPTGITNKVGDDEEEKKLYEASKSGKEYKAAVEAVTTTDTSTSASKVVPENESTRKDRLNRFRRNRFTDIRKDETKQPDETSDDKPPKSKEEAALESQAVTEILKEVQRGAARAKEHGALGWQRCPIPVTNKTFLRNTLVSTLREPYRPPNKRGRFHVGLKQNEDSSKHHGKRESDNNSRSSRSSRSSSRSRRSSRSQSRSSFTDDEPSGSRDTQGHFHRGGGRGMWHRGRNQYYDEAWATYAAHYGYPWYGPEAMPMFYGQEGWPVDPYAAMYYGDPQAWMEYEAYYGPQNFNARGMGRGFRGRGRGDRGRGRGGYEGNFQEYHGGFQSPREFSRSRSRGELSRSWSRNRSLSRSRAKSVDSRGRSRSRSLSRGRTQSHSRSHRRSADRSSYRDSDGRIRSDSDVNEKKKKKKKKKRKHKKSKKSKHRRKGDENKINEKDVGGHVEGDAEKAYKDGKKEKLEEQKEDSSDNLGKGGSTVEQRTKEHFSHRLHDKSLKQGKGQEKEAENDDNEKTVSGNVELKDKMMRKCEHTSKGVEESSTHKRQTKRVHKGDESGNKKMERIAGGEERMNSGKSKDSQDIRRSEGVTGKHRGETGESYDITARDRRSSSQDSNKRGGIKKGRGYNSDVIEQGSTSESGDSKLKVKIRDIRDKTRTDITERDRRQDKQGKIGEKYKDGRNIGERDRQSESHDNSEETRRHGRKRKLGEDEGTAQDQGSMGTRIGDIRDKEGRGAGIRERERSESHDSRERIRIDDDTHKQARNIKYRGNNDERLHYTDKVWKSKSDSSSESRRKVDGKSKDVRNDRSNVKESGKTNVKDRLGGNFDARQRLSTDGNKYQGDHDGSRVTKMDDTSYNSKERKRLDAGKMSMETKTRGKSPNKKTVDPRKDTKDKKNTSVRNDSKGEGDQHVDRKQMGKIICSVDRQGQREISADNDNNEGKEKHRESRSGHEREYRQTKGKKDSLGGMRDNEHLIADREIKGNSFENESTTKSNSGSRDIEKSTVQGYHTESTKELPQVHENQQYDRDNYKERHQFEKCEHTKGVHTTQLNNENDIAASSKNIRIKDSAMTEESRTVKDLDMTEESRKNIDITGTKYHLKRMYVAASENSSVTENVAENKTKVVKRKKKVLRKQGESKKMKSDAAREHLEDEDFQTDSKDEPRKRKMKLKQKKKLKEVKFDKSSEAGVE